MDCKTGYSKVAWASRPWALRKVPGTYCPGAPWALRKVPGTYCRHLLPAPIALAWHLSPWRPLRISPCRSRLLAYGHGLPKGCRNEKTQCCLHRVSDRIALLEKATNAWRTELHGEHREDRTSFVPSFANRESGIRRRGEDRSSLH